MRTETLENFVITAWAEQTPSGWQGIACVHPSIPDYWHGGPSGDSLILNGFGSSEAHVEAIALVEARTVLLDYIEKSLK